MKLVILGILLFVQSCLQITLATDQSIKENPDSEEKANPLRYSNEDNGNSYKRPTTINAHVPSYSKKYTKATTYSKQHTEYVPSYSKTYSKISQKVNWAYWTADVTYNNNQGFQPSDFASVDCDLSPNLIYWNLQNINFGKNLQKKIYDDSTHNNYGKNLVFDWADPSLGEDYLQKLHIVKERCPHASVAIDPKFVWDKNLADQIGVKFSIDQVVDSLLDFNLKYKSDGMVISFAQETVLDDKLTYNFLKQLKKSLSAYNIKLLFVYGRPDFTYVRPVAFEFADLIILFIEDFREENRNTLEHFSPAFGTDNRNANNLIDLFVNMGAPRSIISLALITFGFSFKRVSCQPETNAGCPANGVGSTIYADHILLNENKNVFRFFHDQVTLCRLNEDPTWTKKFDNVAKVPYAFNSEQWISYENEKSIKIKVDLVKDKEISGVTIIVLNADDINGLCGQGKYPLTRLITDEIHRSQEYTRY